MAAVKGEFSIPKSEARYHEHGNRTDEDKIVSLSRRR
jgi:hypothetical protein